MPSPTPYDVLILGSGAAGLTLALRLPRNLKVGVLSKARLREGSTYYAQGGISAVLDDEDSFDAHIQDTINAGAGLCREDTVRFVVERGPAAIERLIRHGVNFSRFTKKDGSFLKISRFCDHQKVHWFARITATGGAIFHP